MPVTVDFDGAVATIGDDLRWSSGNKQVAEFLNGVFNVRSLDALAGPGDVESMGTAGALATAAADHMGGKVTSFD